jgi:hypothetical protein
MPTVSTYRPRRQRKPLLPVNITAQLTGGEFNACLPEELARGVAILSIATGDDTDRDVKLYWTRFLFHNGEAYAVELTRFGTAKKYIITLEDETCNCPDAEYRSERPGGCRHVVALRQALPAVANAATGKAGAA